MRRSKPSFFLMKNTGAPMGDLGWMDAAICKVLLEEVIKLLLFCRGQGECLGVREFSHCEINGMVPCLPQWELIKGFLGEDISEVVVLGQCRWENGPI